MRITALLLMLGVASSAIASPTDPVTQAAAPAATATPTAPTAPTAPAAPAATAAPAAPATPAAPAAVPPDVLKKAAKVGLRPRQRKGTTMFCKDYAEIGTRIPTEHCYSVDGLDVVVQQMEDAQAQMRKAGACGGANCGN